MALTTTPVLSVPDFAKPFIIHCDASNVGVGAVLLQGEGENEHVISFMSKKLDANEVKFSATERECSKFPSIYRRCPFYSDHRSFFIDMADGY